MVNKNNICVISLELFSKNNSNGRALGTMLEGLENKEISQFSFKPGRPNLFDANYFVLEEKSFKNPFSKRTFYQLNYSEDDEIASTNTKRVKRTPFICFIREFLWKLNGRKLKRFSRLIIEKKPDILIIQDADIISFYKFCLNTINTINVPVIFYTTENYAFKKVSYLTRRKNSLLYSIFRKKLFKWQRKLVESSKTCVFLTKGLEEEYKQYYEIQKSYIIMPPSNISPVQTAVSISKASYSYCGNLGVGRFESLLLFSDILLKENIDGMIYVCSNCSKKQIQEMSQRKNIVFYGYKDKEFINALNSNATILLHFESFDRRINEDCKHAFTGKIGELLCYNSPILYFGPLNNDLAKFLVENECAEVCDKIDDIGVKISNCMLHSKEIVKKAHATKNKYFDCNTTQKVLEDIISELSH